MSSWALAFFGLTTNDREALLDQHFLLMYYLGFTYRETYNIPVKYRTWFIERTGKEINKNAEKDRPPHHAAHSSDPEYNAMMGHYRSQEPARLRRFK